MEKKGKKQAAKKCILSDEIMKLSEAWCEEKKGERSIIIIATEHKKKGCSTSNYVCGKGGNLIDAFANTLLDTDDNNVCARLMRRAVAVGLLQKNIEKLDKSLEKIEKLSKAMLSDDTEETERETNNVKEDK